MALERSPGVDVPSRAVPIALYLNANGNQIQGDSIQEATMGAIECLSFHSGVRGSERTGIASAGRRTHDGLAIRKPIDRATPLLARALCQNENIDAEFRFFRPNPNGDGTTEHFFTVEIADARLRSIEISSPDGLSNPSTSPTSAEPFEDVQFSYNGITWRYEPEGVEHVDTIARM